MQLFAKFCLSFSSLSVLSPSPSCSFNACYLDAGFPLVFSSGPIPFLKYQIDIFMPCQTHQQVLPAPQSQYIRKDMSSPLRKIHRSHFSNSGIISWGMQFKNGPEVIPSYRTSHLDHFFPSMWNQSPRHIDSLLAFMSSSFQNSHRIIISQAIRVVSYLP